MFFKGIRLVAIMLCISLFTGGNAASAEGNNGVSLRILGDSPDASIEQTFVKEHPGIDIIHCDPIYTTAQQIAESFVIGGNDIDIYIISAANADFTALKEKGYCMDLSSSETLSTAANNMYPFLQKCIMENNRIYAIPLLITSSAWVYDPHVLDELEDQIAIPNTFIELCDLLKSWPDSYSEEYADYSIIPSTDNVRNFLVRRTFKMYSDYYASLGKPLDLNTDLFRKLMSAIEDACTSFDQDNSQSADEKASRLIPNEDILYLSGDLGFIPFMLLLDTDVPYIISADATIAFINPKSAHASEAMIYLEHYVANYSQTSKIQLFQNESTPIINEDHEVNVMSWQSKIADCEKRLQEAEDDEVRDIRTDIQYYKALLDDSEAHRYTVSASMIAKYKELASNAFIPNCSILYAADANSDEFFTLLDLYVAKQLTLDQLINEGNKKISMMQQEAN